MKYEQKVAFALSIGLFVAMLMLTPVFAATQSACDEHDLVVDQLLEQYGETRQSIALARNKMLVEVYANQESGTWTFVFTDPEGKACVVAFGGSYQSVNDTSSVGDGA